MPYIKFIYLLLPFLSHAANERNIFSLKKNGTVPNYVLDGMTNDIDGNLFIATYGANKVMKIDPKYVKHASDSDISIRFNLLLL